MAAIESVTLLDAGAALQAVWGDGKALRFHAVWLRDNALDPATRAPGNGQRLITLADIPRGIRIATAEAAGGDLAVTFAPEGKTARFPGAWLRAHAYDRPQGRAAGWVGDEIETWDGALGAALPEAGYEALRSNARELAAWLAAVRRYGFAKLTGGPVEPGALTRVVDLFGCVRETNYGRWFEVRTEIDPTNLAYTGLGLQAHTDNPYRDPVPTMKILYSHENSAEGGENKVVDGFRAEKRLKEENPAGY
jgi:gamma-butyrobetaine dioxygenase